MPSSAFAVFREAILARRQVTFTYRDKFREACPHVLGWKNGKERALVFQFGGESTSGLPAGGNWRCVQLDAVTGAVAREGDWHTAPATQAQRCVDKVDTQIPGF